MKGSDRQSRVEYAPCDGVEDTEIDLYVIEREKRVGWYENLLES